MISTPPPNEQKAKWDSPCKVLVLLANRGHIFYSWVQKVLRMLVLLALKKSQGSQPYTRGANKLEETQGYWAASVGDEDEIQGRHQGTHVDRFTLSHSAARYLLEVIRTVSDWPAMVTYS